MISNVSDLPSRFSSDLTMNPSSPSPIHMMRSESCMLFAWDGFKLKSCGDVTPSNISCGSPTPFITPAVSECRGLIETTTFGAAFAVEIAIVDNSAIDNARNMIGFQEMLCYYIPITQGGREFKCRRLRKSSSVENKPTG